MSEKFIIVDENKGAFVGTYAPDDVGEEFDEVIEAYRNKGVATKKIGLLFADDNIFNIDRCAAFESQERAKDFIHWMLNTFSTDSRAAELRLTILPCQAEGDKHATALELLRSGHVKHVKEMANDYWELYRQRQDDEDTVH